MRYSDTVRRMVVAASLTFLVTTVVGAVNCTHRNASCFTWGAGPGSPYPGYCCSHAGLTPSYQDAQPGKQLNVVPDDANGEQCGHLYDVTNDACGDFVAAYACGGSRGDTACDIVNPS